MPSYNNNLQKSTANFKILHQMYFECNFLSILCEHNVLRANYQELFNVCYSILLYIDTITAKCVTATPSSQAQTIMNEFDLYR